MADEVRAFLDTLVRQPDFLGRYPYYAAVLSRMVPVADPSVQRMAVSLFGGRFYLHVNVESFVREPQFLRGVLLHEVHHVVLGHLSHPKYQDPTEPELMELALEMSANEYIEEPLPDPIVWQKYAPLGIFAGQSTLERYEILLEAQRAQKLKGKTAPSGERVDDHRLLRQTAGAPGAVEQTRQLVARAVEAAGPVEPEGQKAQIAGKTPGKLLEELVGAPGPAECFLDWKTALGLFVGRARSPVHSYARPSRRFPHRIGEVPGRTWAPRTIESPRLCVAIDTSMSMGTAELEEIARQLAELSKRATLTVVECDVAIRRVYPFAGALADVAGRGGTDLRPVFSPAFLGARIFEGIVYFTDGLGPFPDAPPPLPTLWVLTKPFAFQCPWGERAHLERKRPAPGAVPVSPASRKARPR